MPVASVREVPLGLVRGHGQQPLQVRAEELLNELHVRQQLEPLDVLLVLDPHAPLSHTHTHEQKAFCVAFRNKHASLRAYNEPPRNKRRKNRKALSHER